MGKKEWKELRKKVEGKYLDIQDGPYYPFDRLLNDVRENSDSHNEFQKSVQCGGVGN